MRYLHMDFFVIKALQMHTARLRHNDVKYQALRDFLRSALINESGEWTEKRVVVFAEYHGTQEYLLTEVPRPRPIPAPGHPGSTVPGMSTGDPASAALKAGHV